MKKGTIIFTNINIDYIRKKTPGLEYDCTQKLDNLKQRAEPIIILI